MSSSSTASLTDKRSSTVVDSAMTIGLNSADVLVGLVVGRGDDVARRIDGFRSGRCIGGARVTLLEPALVAAQTLLDAQRRLIGAGIGVGGHAVSMQDHAGIEVDGAFGAKAEAFLARRSRGRNSRR